jgi:hypothetical protein
MFSPETAEIVDTTVPRTKRSSEEFPEQVKSTTMRLKARATPHRPGPLVLDVPIDYHSIHESLILALGTLSTAHRDACTNN